jgi:hypothetical protein
MADEEEMRRRADALLAVKQTEAAKAKALARKTKKRPAVAKLRAEITARKAKRTKKDRRGFDFLELAKKRKAMKRKKIPAAGGYSLFERLVARTDPDKWYSFAQLQKLLPETGKAGLKFTVYQKARDLGMLERRALIEDPDRPWLFDEKHADRGQAASQSRYVYRIGAKQPEFRARARLKEAAATSVYPEG